MATAIEDAVKSIGAEVQLSSPLGAFLQRLARAVGAFASSSTEIATEVAALAAQIPALAAQVAALAAAKPDYGWVKRGGSPQLGVTTGTNIIFTSPGPIRGITYTDRWTLNPGKTYLLRLIGAFENFSNGDGQIQLKFTDDTNTPLTDPTADSPSGIWFPETANVQSASGPGLEMIYQTPPTFSGLCIVRVLCISATGTADVRQGGMTMVVQEIP